MDSPKHLMIILSLMVPKNKFRKKLCLSFLLELLYVYKFLKMSVIMISSTHLRDDWNVEKKPVRALISFIKVSLFIIIILFFHLWYIIIHSVAPSLILFSPQDRHTLLLKIYQFLPSNFWTTFLLNFFLLLFSCLQFTFCSTLCSEKSLPNWSIPQNPFLLKINI